MNKLLRNSNVIILKADYFRLEFTLSYRDVKVDHSTIQQWLFRFSPFVEGSMHSRKSHAGDSWRMDEIYFQKEGKDRYLY